MSAAPEQIERHLLVGSWSTTTRRQLAFCRRRSETASAGFGDRAPRNHDIARESLNGGNCLSRSPPGRRPVCRPRGRKSFGVRRERWPAYPPELRDRGFAVLGWSTSPGSTRIEVLPEASPGLSTAVLTNCRAKCCHPSSLLFANCVSRTTRRELPVTSQLRSRRGKAASLSRTTCVKTVFVNHHADSASAAIGKAAHHSSATIHLHIGCRAHDIGGKRNCKIDRRTHGTSASMRNRTPLAEMFSVSIEFAAPS